MVAARGCDWMLLYTYTNSPFTVNLDKIGGDKKWAWWYDVTSGKIEPAGEYCTPHATFRHDGAPEGAGNDRVLLVTATDSPDGIAPR